MLSVLFHHLSATLLPGGFIGVDVFFVISGYLITSQVYKEVCDGTFSIRQFYKRRINRIAPALVTVIITTFIVGAILALLVARNQSVSRIFSTLSFIAGLSLIGGSLFLLDKSSPFPGVNAIWPCLGAALIIWSGANPQPISRILTNRHMVFVGLISYSLYLWHWPIIAFLNYSNIHISPIVGLWVVLSSITLAYLSWRFIETPMRRTGVSLSFQRVFIQRFVIPAVALLSIGLAMEYTDGLSKRFDPRVAEFEKAIEGDVSENGK